MALRDARFQFVYIKFIWSHFFFRVQSLYLSAVCYFTLGGTAKLEQRLKHIGSVPIAPLKGNDHTSSSLTPSSSLCLSVSSPFFVSHPLSGLTPDEFVL